MWQSPKAAVSALSCYVPVCVFFFELYWELYSDLSVSTKTFLLRFSFSPCIYFLFS